MAPILPHPFELGYRTSTSTAFSLHDKSFHSVGMEIPKTLKAVMLEKMHLWILERSDCFISLRVRCQHSYAGFRQIA